MRVGVILHEKNHVKAIQYCHEADISEVCLTCSSIEGYEDEGYLNLDSLNAYKNNLERFGIKLRSMVITKYPTQKALLGEPGSEKERENLFLTIENLGKAKIEVAVIYPLVERPFNKLEQEERWKKIIKFYDSLVNSAERFKVKLANHAFYHPWSMIRNVKTLCKLLKEVPSPYHGVTYCPGLYQMGDDPYKAIITLDEKIFLAHARNLKKIWSHPRFEEVSLEKGDIDIAKVLRFLETIGYNGLICPEHLGEPCGEEDMQVKAVKYLQNLLAKIDNS